MRCFDKIQLTTILFFMKLSFFLSLKFAKPNKRTKFRDKLHKKTANCDHTEIKALICIQRI